MFICDQFEVIELLGKGGGGAVYKAKQKLQDRFVAIKVLNESFRNDESKLRKFQREAKTTSGLDHPHIVKVFAFGLDSEDHPYFAMEYLEGKTLAELFAEKEKLSNLEFAEIFSQVCSALEYAHEQGVIHRDLKPENIMVTTNTGGEHNVKLLDFGIASLPEIDSGKTTTLVDPNKLVGSPLFMSPEQCQGQKADARSDIYSLGCIMYQSVSGSPPFTGASAHEVILKHLYEKPAALDQSALKISPSIEKMVLRCLDKNPVNRIQTVRDINKELPAALQHYSARKNNWNWPGNKWKIAIFLALIILIAVTAGFVAKKNEGASKAPVTAAQNKPDFAAIYTALKHAEKLNSDGQNSASVPAYKAVVDTAKQYDYPADSPTGKKLARIEYRCYRGIAKARMYSEESVGPEALRDWEDCYYASLRSFEHGSKNIAEAESRTAFAYMMNDPKPEKLEHIENLCRKAMKSLEIEMAASASARLFNLRSDNLTRTSYADANIIVGHLRAMGGEPKIGAAIISEFLDFREKIDERSLLGRVWLCQALNKAKLKKEEAQAIEQFFREINSNSKLHPKVRVKLIDTLFDCYLNSGQTLQCINVADSAMSILRSEKADAGQIARCLYYKSLAAGRLKRSSDAAKWLKESQAEQLKAKPISHQYLR